MPNPDRPGEFLVQTSDGSIIPVDAELAAALQAEEYQAPAQDLFAQGRVVPTPNQATDATPAPTQRVGGVFGEGGIYDAVDAEVTAAARNLGLIPDPAQAQRLQEEAGPALDSAWNSVFGTPQAQPVVPTTPAQQPVQENPPAVLNEFDARSPTAAPQAQGPQTPATLDRALMAQNARYDILDLELRSGGYMLDRESLERGVINVVPDPSFRTGGGVSGALRARASTASEAFDTALQNMMNSIMNGAELKGKEGEGAAALLGDLDTQLADQEQEFQRNEQQRQQEIDRELDELGQRMDQFSSLRVDPGRVFASAGGATGMSAAVNVAAGMLASAITNGLAPGTDLPNTALQILETAVENDIRAQMANADIASQSVANQNSLLNFMMGRIEDQRGVEDGLRAVLLQRASNMLEQHMLRMQSPQVRNQAQLVIDRINLNIAAAQQQALQAAMRRAGRGRRRQITAGARTMIDQAAGGELNIHRYAGGEPQRPGSFQERQQGIQQMFRQGDRLPGGFVITNEAEFHRGAGQQGITASGLDAMHRNAREAEPYVSTRRGLLQLIELTAPENTNWASPTWRQQVQAAAAGVRMDVVGNLYNQGALQALDFEAAERIVADATSVRGAFDLGQRQSLINLEGLLRNRIQNFAQPGAVHEDLLPGNPGRGSQRPSTARPAGPGE